MAGRTIRFRHFMASGGEYQPPDQTRTRKGPPSRCHQPLFCKWLKMSKLPGQGLQGLAAEL